MDEGETEKLSAAARRRWDMAAGRIRYALVEFAIGEGLDANDFDEFCADALTKLAAEYRLSADTAGAVATAEDRQAHAAAVEEAACDYDGVPMTDADQQPDPAAVDAFVAKLQGRKA